MKISLASLPSFFKPAFKYVPVAAYIGSAMAAAHGLKTTTQSSQRLPLGVLLDSSEAEETMAAVYTLGLG